MFLKFVVFALIALVLYRLAGGRLPFLNKKSKVPPPPQTDDTAMVECKQCGTFVAVNEALLVNGTYFCSKECTPK